MTWQDILKRPNQLPFSLKRNQMLLAEISRSVKALQDKDIAYLIQTFPSEERWRILQHFLPDASFLDIETTGLSMYSDKITLVVCHHRNQWYVFTADNPLDPVLDLLHEVPLLVTFNGSSFDVPFILQTFHIPNLPCPHLDLRWVCYHRNYKGSLSTIEERLGITRAAEVQSIDGLEAVRLWQRWKAGDSFAKATLIQYCQADVQAMITIAHGVV